MMGILGGGLLLGLLLLTSVTHIGQQQLAGYGIEPKGNLLNYAK